MTLNDDTLAAAAAIIQGLAKDVPESAALPFNGNKTSQPANGVDLAKIKLPGDDSEAKAALEKELSALVQRVNTMQTFVVSLVLFSFQINSI